MFVVCAVVSRRRDACSPSSPVEVAIGSGAAASPGAAAASAHGIGGYLASVVTDETGCGSVDSPWLLRTAPGQTIRLSLFDFDGAARSSAAAAAADSGHDRQSVCQVGSFS